MDPLCLDNISFTSEDMKDHYGRVWPYFNGRVRLSTIEQRKLQLKTPTEKHQQKNTNRKNTNKKHQQKNTNRKTPTEKHQIKKNTNRKNTLYIITQRRND